MAEGTIDGRDAARPVALWTELFRVFQVSLDPKKIFLAAAGVLATGVAWYLLSWAAIHLKTKPVLDSSAYAIDKYGGADARGAEERRLQDYQADLDAWVVMYQAAGETGVPEDYTDSKGVTHRVYGGSLRALPWFEDRGPNPVLVAGEVVTTPGSVQQKLDDTGWTFGKQMKVVLEPLVKFLRPVVYLFKPGASLGVRTYLLLVIVSALLIWAFVGGMITRLAAVELAGKDPLSTREAFRYVAGRYITYLFAPILPLIGIAVIVILQILFGLIHLIPWVGDVWDALLYPLMLLAGIGSALILVGLVGYPLIFATVSAEGSDTFDAVSRTYSYVYTALWHYLWYGFVVTVYGAALVFIVSFLGSLMVYMAKWGLDRTPHGLDRDPSFLFVYAPTTFGWRDLLLQGSGAIDPVTGHYSEARRAEYMSGPAYQGAVKPFAAFMVGVWLSLAVLLIVGYAYAYFWTAATQVYLLLRRKVDDTDLDEVYLEDETPEDPFAQPKPATTSLAQAVSSTQVTMVEPPALRTAPPPAAPPTPPPVAPSQPLVETPAVPPPAEPPVPPPPRPKDGGPAAAP